MSVPRVLSIAGSDPSGGAGIQADLKTFAAHGVYGMAVITALTAQNTTCVSGIEVASAAFVESQLRAVVEDCLPCTTKSGMLPDAATITVVAAMARDGRLGGLVLDPVLVATSGDVLVGGDAVEALRQELLPCATLATPNLPEARVLCGLDPADECPVEELGARLLGLGAPAVLIKGGHGHETTVVDRLFLGSDVPSIAFRGTRVSGGPFHGTGCTLSAGIAARLALGDDLVAACEGVIEWLRRALARSWPVGRGARPVDHLTPIDRPGVEL